VELFSDSSSSPKISVAEFSDDERKDTRGSSTSRKKGNKRVDNQDRIDSRPESNLGKSGGWVDTGRSGNGHQNKWNKVDNRCGKKANLNVSDGDQFKQIKDIDIPKKKSELNQAYGNTVHTKQYEHQSKISVTNVPNVTNLSNTAIQSATQSINNLQNIQINPVIIQKLLEDASKNSGIPFTNLNISNFQQVLSNPQVQQLLRQQRGADEISTKTVTPKPSTILNEITTFIENSNKPLNENLPLFQSISQFFAMSIQNPLNQLGLKTPLYLLKINDFNEREPYQRYLKASIDNLYEIRKSCSICGFRTNLSYKFKEHLDIHFHINYIKRNSQKKVLYRKESMSKDSWVNTTSCTQNGIGNTNSTINSVLYYLNDTEHVLQTGSNNKTTESQQENERFLYPVDHKLEAKCAYCNEAFRKRYINKFHYWFYLNVVKIDGSEQLVHENCLEEYIVSPGYEEFLNKKRAR
jgi:hypothetical protein